MANSYLIPFLDYQRIYQVVYRILTASRIADTPHACLAFAAAGALILKQHYGLSPSIRVGAFALGVDDATSKIMLFGRIENNNVECDENAFHAWIECDGWIVDFMSPIFRDSRFLRGNQVSVPRLMFQKPMVNRKEYADEANSFGEFWTSSNSELSQHLYASQPLQFEDLVKGCVYWYRRPPKPLKNAVLGDTKGGSASMEIRVPAIVGSW